jgi:putative acetyltransferase
MAAVVVRPEQPGDVRAVRDVHREAFQAHGDAVVDLLDELRATTDGAAVSLVAADGDRIVGHVLLSPCLLDAPRQLVDALVLSPLGVLAGYRSRGIGTRLVRAAIDAAEAARAPLVLLEGDPAYYGRLGFVAGGSMGLRRPSLRIPEAAFQALPLSRYAPWMTGTMVYPDVWWRHDAVGLR